MLNKAVRMYGQNDLRLDTFELPEIKDDEILVKVISDSICMSSYKAALQGSNHKRVPDNISEHPAIIGHEFCGLIEKVGAKWADKFTVGEKFTIQPAISYKGTLMTPGYAFEYCGGDSQHAILLPEIMEQDCLLDYKAKEFFYGSLSEPLSCIIGTFHAQYHTKPGCYVHEMGIREGGNMAILAGAGPMGLGAIDYAIHCDRKPGLLVVTDIDQARLDRAASIYTVEDAAKNGVKLVYANTRENAVETLMGLTDGKGYDDVLVFAPVPAVIEQGDAILAFDGCLNFFAGPTNPALSANFNFYNVHYAAHHLVGTSGGNSTNPTRFQHPVAGTYKKERLEAGRKYFSVASGGGTGRTLHPDNMAAGPASYGMTDTMGRMHSDAQFAGSSSVPAHVEMMGFLGAGNNPMVGMTVAVAVAVEEASK